VPTDLRTPGAVFAGGVLGALARAGLEEALGPARGAFPWTTLAVNLLGAALLAAVVLRDERGTSSGRHERSLVGTGFCGALTTFSTLQLELLHLLDDGALALALAYAAASVLGGLVVVAAVRRAL
jgi:fluoride exporter